MHDAQTPPAGTVADTSRWYELDADNRVVAVDALWDSFAQANGGAGGVAAERVLGRPLKDFVLGDVTRMYLESAVEAARVLGRPRVLPYRCDAPDRRRQFEMVITPLAGGGVRVAHRLLVAQPRPAVLPVRYRPPGGAPWLRCSQCLRLADSGAALHWRTAEEVDRAEQGPGQPAPSERWPRRVSDTVCPACQARLQAVVPAP